jgi:hypothetical protein
MAATNIFNEKTWYHHSTENPPKYSTVSQEHHKKANKEKLSLEKSGKNI